MEESSRSNEPKRNFRDQRSYWMRMFKDLTPEMLITPSNINKSKETKREIVEYVLEKKYADRLTSIAKDSELSLYILCVSIFKCFLYRYTDKSILYVASPSYRKMLKESLQDNIVILKSSLMKDETIKEVILKEKEVVMGAFNNQNYPYEKIIEELNYDFGKSYDVLASIIFFSREIHCTDSISKDKHGLLISYYRTKDKFIFSFEYNNLIYDDVKIELIVKYFDRVLKQAVDNLSIKLCDLELIDEFEKNQILFTFNTIGERVYEDRTISELFEQQVEKTPDEVAVAFKDKKITYKELNAKSNQLARALRAQGVKPNEIVSIVVDSSVEMILGLLAVMKSGGAFLPIDSEYSIERVKYMLENSKSNIIITKKNIFNIKDFKGKIIDLDEEDLFLFDSTNLEKVNSLGDISYVIYTSGSTGKPKGVVIENKSIASTLQWRKKEYSLNFKHKVLPLISFAFDGFITSALTPLISGSELHLLDSKEIKDTFIINKYLFNYKITHIISVPSFFMHIVDDFYADEVKCITLAGDKLTPSLVKKINKKIEIINEYGPTENSVITTIQRNVAMDSEISIGKPKEDTWVYIVNSSGKLQPIGLSGELCIGGNTLAREYLYNSQLTLQKFVCDPFMVNGRMYKTGDLARWLPNGTIEFLGRIDNQVKVRGFRIEIEEIETKLAKHKDIKEAIVTVKEGKNEEKYLCAYIVEDVNLTVSELRQFLMEELPEYMVPSKFIKLREMPVNSNGKIDRKALLQVNESVELGTQYVEPQNEIQQKMVKVWQDSLLVDKVGINDDFFSLGGCSLKAMEVMSGLQEYNLSLEDLFKYTTIAELSNRVQAINGNLYEHDRYIEILKDIELLNIKYEARNEKLNCPNYISNKGIEPFNDVIYINCFFNALFSILLSYRNTILPFLSNDLITYCYNSLDMNSCIDTEYIFYESPRTILNKQGVNVRGSIYSKNIVNDIRFSLMDEKLVIINVDCFYESIREDMYLKQHWPHALLVYGYDDNKKVFHILEHDNVNSLNYERKLINYEDLINSYEGYLKNFQGTKDIPTYFEFHMKDNFEDGHSNHKEYYGKKFSQNFINKNKDIACGLEALKSFIVSFSDVYQNEEILLQKTDKYIFSFNNVIKAKRMEKYRCEKLFGETDEAVNIISRIESNWVYIKLRIEKYQASHRYNLDAMKHINSKLNEILELEYEYVEAIKSKLNKI